MHDTASTTALTHLLNQFSVPMFAVERDGPDATFRFVCLNDVMAATGDLSASETLGKSAFDVLPPQEAKVVNSRYLECALTRNVVRFRDGLTTGGRRAVWDTTLQFVHLPDGTERVVGTSIRLSAQDSVQPETVAFEDIGYISTVADFQLQNLVTLFETYRDRDLFQVEAAPRIDKLSGMCRSIQRAVADIRKLVNSAQRQPSNQLAAEDTASHIPSNVPPSSMVKALVEYSAGTNEMNGAS